MLPVWTWLLIVCFSGHCLHEIFVLREGMFKRIPDIVVWPGKLKVFFLLPSDLFTKFLCSLVIEKLSGQSHSSLETLKDFLGGGGDMVIMIL